MIKVFAIITILSGIPGILLSAFTHNFTAMGYAVSAVCWAIVGFVGE